MAWRVSLAGRITVGNKPDRPDFVTIVRENSFTAPINCYSNGKVGPFPAENGECAELFIKERWMGGLQHTALVYIFAAQVFSILFNAAIMSI